MSTIAFLRRLLNSTSGGVVPSHNSRRASSVGCQVRQTFFLSSKSVWRCQDGSAPINFSSMAMKYDGGDDQDNRYQNDSSSCTDVRHCRTCTCERKASPQEDSRITLPVVEKTVANSRFACGANQHEDELDNLPDPLPEPKYSVHKRVLPSKLTAFSSEEGRKMLMEALFLDGTAESYWALTEHFINQGDPAFCGVTTLIMCLNALCIDPNIRWRGGWRYYGSEEVLLDRCCLSTERIRRLGISLEDFCQLGRCQGLRIELKRPEPLEKSQDRTTANGSHAHTLEEFREDVSAILSDKVHRPLLVVSFSRAALRQTGDGHFSTVAAYHKASDKVLILDVARFKYAPYWVSVEDLFHSMQELDSVTQKPRGWFLLRPPKNHGCRHVTQEDRRPIEVVPLAGEKDICPIADVRREFCKSNPDHAMD